MKGVYGNFTVKITPNKDVSSQLFNPVELDSNLVNKSFEVISLEGYLAGTNEKAITVTGVNFIICSQMTW